MVYNYLILGAGVTGLTLLNKLKEKGENNILALEAESEAGGLCRTFYIEGHASDIGGHFFQTKFKDVEEFVFSKFPKDSFYKIDPRISKINIHDIDIDYPLEANLWQLPKQLLIDYLLSVIRNGESLGKAEPKNYEEWIRWKLGDKICENYLIPYNIKLWGISPDKMDVDWLQKIPRLEVKEILEDSLYHKQDIEKFPAHVSPYYPKSGGYGRVMEAIADGVNDLIKYNCKVKTLAYDLTNKVWVVNDNYYAKNIITTIPWPDLYEALGRPQAIRDDINKIKYNKIVISLFETETNPVPYHWRYTPSLNEQHHREFYISNFAKDSKNYGVFTETNSERFDEAHLTFKGKNLFNYETPAAYPLPLIGRTAAISRILDYYRPLHLFGIGRWGEHMHHNQDVCIKHAIDFVNNLQD